MSFNLPDKGVRIGYTRASDPDCVNSSYWLPGDLRDMLLTDLTGDADVNKLWWRDAANEVHYLKGGPEVVEETPHICDTQHPDDPTACPACLEEDPPMLVCDDCGESFDSIVAAYTHTTLNEDDMPEACGREFRIVAQSEAM